jgi:exosortase
LHLTSVIGLLPSALAMTWLVWRARGFWTRNPEMHFGWIVLVLCGYLFWETWPKRPPFRGRWRLGGLTLAGSGFMLLFGAQIYGAAYGATTEGLAALGLGVMLFIAGNFHYAFGSEGVRRFAFPVAFFLIALPVPDTIYYPLVGSLQAKVASINVDLLSLAGIPAERAGNAIRLSSCVVGIDEACSGIRSLQSAVMATLFIGYLTVKRRGLQAVLLGLGVLWAFAGNLVRSFFLSYVANANGAGAIAQYHDAAGWSILAFTAVGVALCAWLLSRVEKALERESGAVRSQ